MAGAGHSSGTAWRTATSATAATPAGATSRRPGARQAAGDEGAGDPALRPGQRQPGHDRQAARGEPRRRPQVDPGGRRRYPGAFGHSLGQHRADRRNVALRGREKNKVRVWRAFDPVARRTLAWELGGRDDATCRRLLDKVGIDGHVFVTDDWEGFQRLIPAEQLFTGKALTFPIEQDDSDIRHHLARFRRRSKVTSRARHMVDGALRLPAATRQLLIYLRLSVSLHIVIRIR